MTFILQIPKRFNGEKLTNTLFGVTWLQIPSVLKYFDRLNTVYFWCLIEIQSYDLRFATDCHFLVKLAALNRQNILIQFSNKNGHDGLQRKSDNSANQVHYLPHWAFSFEITAFLKKLEGPFWMACHVNKCDSESKSTAKTVIGGQESHLSGCFRLFALKFWEMSMLFCHSMSAVWVVGTLNPYLL